MNLPSNLTPPKPKEHGAWGMLYVPLVIAVGIAGVVNLEVLFLTLAVTLLFLSQRPYTQLLTNPTMRQDLALARRHVSWLAIYWSASAVLVGLLYVQYDLTALSQFAWMGIPIATAFTFFLKKNRARSVAGELTGICGLTLTAPLAHYAATGKVQPLGFWLWGLCILYFASSVFYVKAIVAQFLSLRSKATNGVYGLVCGLYHVCLLILLAGLVVLGKIPGLVLVAFLPVIFRGLMRLRRPQAKLSFARIGWTEVAYSIVFASVSILAMRLVI
jgi:hypothetical protein